ncbi:MAG: DUF434 domain-containing protein [Saprospiraceae bacterium]|nr:DUF434 domain-containing protein [Saprospiraceae bacterium]
MAERNRGKLSNDDKWFAQKWHASFKDAVDDVCFLLSRGYGENSALQLVGNRYRLNKRQRMAISRGCCSDIQSTKRRNSEIFARDLLSKVIEIDGFNILIFLESLLSRAYVFKGRDGVYRDISSVHGSYKRVMKTEEAIYIIGKILSDLDVHSVNWYLDSPVSNSGRLKTKLLEISKKHDFNWQVELVFDPDKVLAKSEHVVISSDSWILDQSQQWFNLNKLLVDSYGAHDNLIDL